MKQTPILHFHGRFKFHMPEYNNDARNQKQLFDPNLAKETVLNICGCDPSHYFEFSFQNVNVSQVTYADGTMATNSDEVIGQRIDLSGFLADISPSAICAVLYSGRLGIGNLLQANIQKAIQSDLRLNVRPEGFGDETAAAHFETVMNIKSIQKPKRSRYFAELENVTDLELYFQVNHYTRMDNVGAPETVRLTGDVYGYIRPVGSMVNGKGLRIKHRRLVAHPRIEENAMVEQTYLRKIGNTPMMRITDIDGTYDILEEDQLLAIRYLDFVPFLDRNYTTPEVDTYAVYFDGPTGKIGIGEFNGTHEEMKSTGGLLVFRLVETLIAREDLRLAVDVVKTDAFTQPLMIETEWDLILETDRGFHIGSNNTAIVSAVVYNRNRPASGHKVFLRTQERNRRSPIVAVMDGQEAFSDSDGRIKPSIRAVSLMNANDLFDPVTEQNFRQLPWDRYYGNYVYLSIDNPLRRTKPALEEIEIAVRVLHVINAEDIPDKVSFNRDIIPLISYHARYYPWLHVRSAGDKYVQFLDLENHESFIENIDEIINRLGQSEEERTKMPRSRDFAIGGLELIRKWREQGMPE